MEGAVLFQQNKSRGRVVPEEVILRLLRRWTVPTLLEAHEVVLGSATE